MTTFSKRPPALSEQLRRLGNPYASLQFLDDAEPEAEMATSAAQVTVPPTAPSATQLQFDLGNALERLPQSGNPYAYVADEDEEALSTKDTETDTHDPVEAVSKVEFRAQCRRIFGPYVPASENGRLRNHHRAFILRNAERPARVRASIIRELAKYDLSNLPGLRPQFNRERDLLTEEKLREIERKATIAD